MTDTNPLTTAFDIQRSAIEQTHQLTHETLEAQKTAVHAMADGLETLEQVSEQSANLSQEAAHAYLDAIEQSVPEADLDDLRALVDDGFENAEEIQAESWSAIHEATDEGVTSFETAADNYGEFVDSSFDTFLSAHEQVEENAEEFEEIDVSAD
ncbi:hypothetical protein [Salinarchaeum laminariae]|uniref:hypothetical protein n=1 Tax=Salinarchaeum laminariae TaxID=869888 RepID=UPI0020BD6A25|nr:hypothetical protein [Salinarchaeum laminariae]